jgi:flagellar hook-basal body protein
MAVGSFSAGLSGLNANSTYLSVIGNNLANINTVAFKTSAVSFADLVSQTVGGTSVNPAQVGLGVVTARRYQDRLDPATIRPAVLVVCTIASIALLIEAF